MKLLTKSSAQDQLYFLMVSSADGDTGMTGLNPVVEISKDGGAYAAPAGAVSEVGKGVYKVAGNVADTSVFGSLLLHAEAPGAVTVDREFQVSVLNTHDAVRMGLTSLPAIPAGAPGGIGDTVRFAGVGVEVASPGIPLMAIAMLSDINGAVYSLDISSGNHVALLDSSNSEAFRWPLISVNGQGKVPATVAAGDSVDAAANKVTLGTAGSGLTALGDTRIAHLDANVTSRMSTFTYVPPLSGNDVRLAVGLAAPNLDTQLGAIGVSASQGGTDPLANTVPGTYQVGTAGYVLGSRQGVVGPVIASVETLRIASSTGGIDRPLSVFQNTTNSFQWQLVDGQNQPLSIGGHGFEFVVHKKDGTIVFSTTAPDTQISTLDGGSGTVDTAQYATDPADLATPGVYYYKFRDTTLNVVFGSGQFAILVAPQ